MVNVMSSTSEAKYKRYMARLEDLSRYELLPRIKISEASHHLIEFTQKTADPFLDHKLENSYIKKKKRLKLRCTIA
jgi:hypothetical protein